MKLCSRCKLEGEFYADRKRRDGLDTVCKSCRKAYQEANKDKLRARAKRYEAKRTARRRAKFVNINLKKEEVRWIARRSESFAAANGYPQLGGDLYDKMIDRKLKGQVMNYGWGLVDVLRELGGRIDADKEPTEAENLKRREHFQYESIDELQGVFGKESKDEERLFAEAFARIRRSPDLDERTKIILQLRYRYGLKQEEIGELFDMTYSNVARLETIGLAFIRRAWIDESGDQ